MAWNMESGTHAWTPEEEDELLSLHDDGFSVQGFAADKRIQVSAVKARLEILLYRRRIAAGRPARVHGVVPAERLADCEARKAAADRRDLTATFFGDPPPGYSALDKRRQSP